MLSSWLDYENGPDVRDSYHGGTGSASYANGITTWYDRPARTMTIAPGQTVSLIISDVGHSFGSHPLQAGSHTLTAKYNSRLRASISFRIVIDEAKTTPLLEQLASASPQDGRDSITWAKNSLNLVRQPSISARIVDTDGQPLKEYVSIAVTGGKTNTEAGMTEGTGVQSSRRHLHHHAFNSLRGPSGWPITSLSRPVELSRT